jgi:hypothetical protein
MLAYDRPSHKYISFLKKHYNLYDYFPQNNNFVVFKDYFDQINSENKVRQKMREENAYNRTYSNPYNSSLNSIGSNQRRGQGVFSVIGSQMLQRADSVKNNRGYSAYEKFQRMY